MKRIVTTLGAMLWVIDSFGATTQADCTDYLKTSDTDYERSSLLFGTNWNSGEKPTQSSTNYIGSGMKLYGPSSVSSENPFEGGCFVLAGTISMHKIGVTWPELRLQNGGVYGWGSNSSLNGNILVESDATAPAAIQSFFGNSIFTTEVYANLRGDPASSLVLRRNSKGPPKTYFPDNYFNVRGNWSEFLGTVTVATNAAIAFLSTATGGNKTMGGKVVVERGGYWWGISGYGYPSSVYTTLGSLDMRDGSVFWAKPDAQGRASLVVVTNELRMGEVTMEYKKEWSSSSRTDADFPPLSNGEAKFPLFKLTGPAAQNVPDFSGVSMPDYPAASKIGGLLPQHKEIAVVQNGDGSKTIYARYFGMGDWVMNTTNEQNGWSDCALNPANTSFWVDGSMPSSDSVGIAYSPQTMEWRGAADADGFDYPNVTFLMDNTLYMYAAYANVSNIVMNPGKVMFVHQGAATKHLRGRLTIISGTSPVYIYNYIGRTVHIDSELMGNGTLDLRSDSNRNPSFTFYINGTNVNFHGSIVSTRMYPVKVSGSVIGQFPDIDKGWYATIYLSDGRNLGGTYTGTSSWSSLTLGAWAKLKIRAGVPSVTLDEPTRGVFITAGGVQVDLAEGQTLAVNEPVTYGGELRKLGAGCLSLGGEARFIDGNVATEPQDGTNRIAVCAGIVKVTSTNAVNGVQMEFSEGAALAVDATPTSAGMSEFGFVNTRWEVPFVPEAVGRPISVVIDGLAKGATATVPICTVTSTAAQGLSFKVRRISGCRATVSPRANADDTVTFVANVEPSGVIMIVK